MPDLDLVEVLAGKRGSRRDLVAKLPIPRDARANRPPWVPMDRANHRPINIGRPLVFAQPAINQTIQRLQRLPAEISADSANQTLSSDW